MIQFFRSIFIKPLFFGLFILCVGLYITAFVVDWYSEDFDFFNPNGGFFEIIANIVLLLSLSLIFLEITLLYIGKNSVSANRKLAEQLSLGDDNKVTIKLHNHYPFKIKVSVIDELPYQLQIRDFNFETELESKQEKEFSFYIHPTKRGAYNFGKINIFVSSVLGLMERRIQIDVDSTFRVYPSILQMKKYELQVFSKTAIFSGIKKVRRIGNNNEFEQIKNYVQGDDIRTINWKATSRKSELMVNQYQEERSQQVYCIIDKSRTMRMPFDGLTLLDHAINSTLALSNIILKKGDKAGMITFSDKLGAKIPAERNASQLRRILETLYNQKTQFLEANFERLYYGTRQVVKGRSMIMLYTNFESMYALKRNIALLRKINQQHLLVVIFFENNELNDDVEKDANSISEIYQQTITKKMIIEKKQIAFELRKYGIQSILTKPNELTTDSINKYLELKSRGMI